MSRRLSIRAHLSSDELEARYRQAKDPVERTHFQIVWLLSQGKSTRAISEHTGYSVTWILEIAHRYSDHGPDGLGDKRKGNPGATPLLTKEQQQRLWQVLHEPSPDGGLWTGQKVADWITKETGRKTDFRRGWEYLRKLGFTLQRPRPRHVKADQEAQEAFQKGA
jgi:transposase